MSTCFLPLFSPSNLGCLEKSGRGGRIPWGKVTTDPESLISPRFQLDTNLADPTRMPLEAITAYWKDWVSRDEKGDPFSFLSAEDDGGDKENGDNGTMNNSQDLPPETFSIDDNIPCPLECHTSDERTSCLQRLVPNSDETKKLFHELVKKVDALEVSYISSDMMEIISHPILGYRYPKWV